MPSILTNTVYCTQADSQIWFMRGGLAVRPTGRETAAFFESIHCEGIRDVRIVATESNSQLIADAYAIGRERGFQIWLMSPLHHHGRYTIDHRSMLQRCYKFTNQQRLVAGSLGGWHLMRPAELPFYLASAAAQRGCSDAELVSLLFETPLFRTVAFCEPIDGVWLAQLFARIRDPRWFVDIDNPDRSAKLYTFLGVGRRTNKAIPDRAMRSVAVGAWRPVASARVDDRNPHAWLYRHYNLQAADVRERERLTTRVFVRFLRAVWLNLIRQESVYPRRAEELFVPEYFFEDAFRLKADDNVAIAPRDEHVDEIIAAYKRHLARFLPA